MAKEKKKIKSEKPKALSKSKSSEAAAIPDTPILPASLAPYILRDVSMEMQDSYLDYAMSVIIARALPDVRDGLKPVHRRILFAMHELGLNSTAKYRKSAAVVGDVLGKYHPHGDIAVYDSMVRMAQDFAMRYPLVDGQGNFGCFTKDTKIKLVDGRNLSFDELIEEYKTGKRNYTYTVNKLGLISIAEIKNPRLTRKNAEIMKVTLDNGYEVKCTPNHLFMLKNGIYKKAKDLKADDSLMPLYQKISEKIDRINREGYILVYQNKTNEWVPAHHLADNWQNPEYRAFMHEKIIKGNKNHITNKTGKVKFLNVCREASKHFSFLNKECYEQIRNKTYPYGAATSWETGLNKYFQNDANLVFQEINNNHKVIKTEKLLIKEDVYDITIDGTHNFVLEAGIFVHNSIDGDSAAAMRYTESRMSKMSEEILADIEKETIDFRDNYDATRKEPVVLPSKVPQLLLNGVSGIAVGMATSIPPHNLREVVAALISLADHPNTTVEDLMEFIKGPDFPTDGIIYDKKAIEAMYVNGRGGVIIRGRAAIEERKGGKFAIVITEIPYMVNKSTLVSKIADLAREKKIIGISDIRDESNREGISVVVELKKDAYPKKILNQLFKYTQLQETFNMNMVALVDGIQPRLLNLKQILENFIAHRKTVITRRTQFELKIAKERLHILEGLKKALDHIDAVIKTIKQSKTKEDAHGALMKKFKLSDLQAKAILEMKLQTLAGLERKKIEDELKEKRELIKYLESILHDPKKVTKIMITELDAIVKKYGDDRKTEIIAHPVGEISIKDTVPNEPMVVAFTRANYIKRMPPSIFRIQHRGGKGVMGMETKEEDEIEKICYTRNHENLLFFTNKGRVFKCSVHEVMQASRIAKGQPIVNLLQLQDGENVTAMLNIPEKFSGEYLIMCTGNGTIKKTAVSDFENVRKSGLIAIKLRPDDSLNWVKECSKNNEVFIVTSFGKSIRFDEANVREMGRASMGVRGIRLKGKDKVVEMDVVKNKNAQLLVVMENGLGKCTKVENYRSQRRGGTGVKTAKITAKTGTIIGAKILDPTLLADLICISKGGQTIRMDVKGIPSQGRTTQGVYLMRLGKGDKAASISLIQKVETDKLEGRVEGKDIKIEKKKQPALV